MAGKLYVKTDLFRPQAIEHPEPVPDKTEPTPRGMAARRLVAELKNRPPTSYLVTGYRGVGKTTMLNQIFETLKTSRPKIVVQISAVTGVKKTELPRMLLRRLQRGLCHELQYGRAKNQSIWRQLPRSVKRMTAAASLQTDNSVRKRAVRSLERAVRLAGGWPEKARGMLLATAVVALLQAGILKVPAVFAALIATNDTALHAPGSPPVSSAGKLSPSYFMWSMVVGLLLFLTSIALELRRNVSEEHEIVSLYDDEIAVNTFLALVERVADKFSLFFVIDEADKLSQEELDAVKDSLKPLFLSGKAHFFLVAGMEAFYRWYSGLQKEDDLFVNLFAGHFHVPAMTDGDLQQLLNQLFAPSPDRPADEPKTDWVPPDQEVSDFLDGAALIAQGRPRRFLTEVARHVNWSNEPPHLAIGIDKTTLHFRAMIYQALCGVRRTLEARNLSPGIEDLLLTLMMEWLIQMAQQGDGSFTAEQIGSTVYQSDEPYRSEVQAQYRLLAAEALNRLIQRLQEAGLLVPDAQTQYRWAAPKQAELLALQFTGFVPREEIGDSLTEARESARNGNHHRAARLFDRGIRYLESKLERAESLVGLAESSLHLGLRPDARRAAEEAVSIYEGLSPDEQQPGPFTRALNCLADICRADGQEERAVELRERARRVLVGD